MKRITDEGEPVVVVPLVVEPVEVGLALRPVPPDVRDLLLALEGNVRNIIHVTVLRILSGLYRIWDQKSSNAPHRVSSFFRKYDRTLAEAVAAAILALPYFRVQPPEAVTAGIVSLLSRLII